ncbi:MAG: Trypsin [Fibrobacteres bacterium]|nr:Trypsin [Fibrobacterota bacterium]
MNKIQYFALLLPVAFLGGCDTLDSKSSFSKEAVNKSAQVSVASTIDQSNIQKASVKAVLEASKSAPQLVCDSVEYEKDGDREVEVKSYRPAVINAKLSILPEVQKELGFDKVRSCEDAKKFIDYMNEHPELAEMFDPFPAKKDVVVQKPDSAGFYDYAPLKKSSVLGGIASNGRYLVYLKIITGASTRHCGAAILDYRTLITSAHCVDKDVTSDNFDKTIDVYYYDPDYGASNPQHVYSGNSHIHVHPPYSGEGDYQSDIAVVAIDGAWSGMDIYDNIRIFNEYMYGSGGGPWGSNVVFWGTGTNANILNTTAGLGVLRHMNSKSIFYAAPYALMTQSNSTQAVCHGDSGGPYIRDDANINFGISLFSSFYPTPNCNLNGDIEYSTMIAPKIPWVTTVTPITCNYMTTSGTGVDYIRCF